MSEPAPALSAKRARFAQAYVYETNGNGAQAAKIAGYEPRVSPTRLLANASVAAEIARLTAERDAALKAEGVRRLENRMSDYQALRDALAATKAARAADPLMAQSPGGATGIVTLSYKTVPNSDPAKPAQTVAETRVDTGLLTSWLAVLKQVAQELGQWVDRKDRLGEALEATRRRVAELGREYGLGPEDVARAVAVAERLVSGDRFP